MKLFPSSKIDFWPFLKLQNMEFGQKNFFVKLNYLISLGFFLRGLFLIFWPTVCAFIVGALDRRLFLFFATFMALFEFDDSATGALEFEKSSTTARNLAKN